MLLGPPNGKPPFLSLLLQPCLATAAPRGLRAANAGSDEHSEWAIPASTTQAPIIGSQHSNQTSFRSAELLPHTAAGPLARRLADVEADITPTQQKVVGTETRLPIPFTLSLGIPPASSTISVRVVLLARGGATFIVNLENSVWNSTLSITFEDLSNMPTNDANVSHSLPIASSRPFTDQT